MLACVCGGLFETVFLGIMWGLACIGLLCKDHTIKFKKRDK